MRNFVSGVLCLFFLYACGEQKFDKGAVPEIEEVNDEVESSELSQEEVIFANDSVEYEAVKEKPNFFQAKEVHQGIYYSLVDNLRIRKEPSLSGALVSTIGYGEKISSLGKVDGDELSLTLRNVIRTGRWFKIRTKSGEVGWAFAGALISDDDIIKVGPTREFKDLETALASTKGNTIIHIDEDRYESENEINVGGYAVKATPEEIEAGLASKSGYISYDCKNTLIEGVGNVELICTDMDANVMMIGSDFITLRNLKMRHEPKVKDLEIGCTGNVVMIDIANDLTIENCDLNGCGRVGVYFNLGVASLILRNNHIWNNSLCAIIDGNEKKLYSEVKDHDHIVFEGNVIEQNGDEYQGDYGGESEYEEYDGH